MPALFPPAIWTERPDVFGPTPLDRLVIGSDGRDQWARSGAQGTHWLGRVTGSKEVRAGSCRRGASLIVTREAMPSFG